MSVAGRSACGGPRGFAGARKRSRAAAWVPRQVEFIKNEEYKYVRLLGAFYLRMVGKPLDVYQYLEARKRIGKRGMTSVSALR